MSLEPEVLGYVIGGVLLVGAVGLGWSMQRTRERELRAWARRQGWEYRGSDSSWAERFDSAPLGTHPGSSRDVLVGRHEDRDAVVFSFHFQRPINLRGQPETLSVVAVELGVPTPQLVVTPKGLVGKVLDTVTGRDLMRGDAPLADAFDEACTVQTDDRAFAGDILTAEAMRLTLDRESRSWRFDSGWLLVVDEGSYYPSDIEPRLRFLSALLLTVDDEVWARLRGEPPLGA